MLGSVTASDGDVVLIAAMVDNQGHIAAPNGQAILGSGGEVFYIPDGQSDIVIKAPANGVGSVSNSGTIAAASVQMKAAGSAYALAVNNSGLVWATGICSITAVSFWTAARAMSCKPARSPRRAAPRR